MNEMETKIQNLLSTYKTAVEEKDVNLFLSIYDQEVVIFDMWGNWEYHGREAWQKVVQEWFESLGNDNATVEIKDIHIVSDHQITCLHAIFTFQGISASGESAHDMDNRFTWILKNQNGIIKIIHEHSSAPIDFEDMKVILKRSPNQPK